jgi:hypothetical protein
LGESRKKLKTLLLRSSRVKSCVNPSRNVPLNAAEKKGDFLQMTSLLTWKMALSAPEETVILTVSGKTLYEPRRKVGGTTDLVTTA